MTVSASAPDGVPEITVGDDLASILLALIELVDGDIVVVTSKVVSKAEGRVLPGSRDEHLGAETVRVVARRGATSIVRTRQGLTLAAAGIDNSNVARGWAVLLPLDPDASARRLRSAFQQQAGVTVGVIVTDTAGRAWREGQTDIAIGAAGVVVAEDFAGRIDAHGNELAVTAPAVADEIAGLAELAQGKLGGRPFAVVRGRADLVLPAGDDGRGAAALVRPDGFDLFGFGAREAVIRAVAGNPTDLAPFGSPVTAAELVAALEQALGPGSRVVSDTEVTVSNAATAAAAIVAFAHGWQIASPAEDADLRFTPVTP
ncbi:MAG: coenzyme F420-0:L-glutamate ligase [Nocardioides sp.]